MRGLNLSYLRIPLLLAMGAVVYLQTASFWIALSTMTIALVVWVAGNMIYENVRAGPFLEYLRENMEPYELEADSDSIKDHVWYGANRYFALTRYYKEGIHLFATSKVHGLLPWEIFLYVEWANDANTQIVLYPIGNAEPICIPWKAEYKECLPERFVGSLQIASS